MLGSFRLWRRRGQLVRALGNDPAQPADHERWLREATSIEHLHASCPRPGWLVYCAYFAELRQDRLLEGALELARHAARIDPRVPFDPRLLDRVEEVPYAELRAAMRACLSAAPGAERWCDIVPTQKNSLLEEYSLEVLDELEEQAAQPTSPYRDLSADADDQARAAAYAMSLETHAHRARGLREALTTRSAAAASLFASAFSKADPAFEREALAILRKAYGWKPASQ